MPPLNFFKLNIDGTRATASGKIGAGGVIRNHAGTWIIGFQINLGVGEILTAEAWGLFYGLKLVVKLQISNLEVESDSAILVNLMQSSNLALHPLGSLLDGCCKLMSRMENAKLSHIFRESNMTADALAKSSISHDLGFISFEDPPVHAAQAFLDDLSSTVRARRSASCFNI
ncbi:PREDICTED: putative ribonuclease H protein At1g65750-like [Fragaria vesca subsp. vesca]